MAIVLAATIRKRWALLTEEDVVIAGTDPHLLAVRIVDRYGIAKQWADREVADWLAAQQAHESVHTA